MDVFKKYAGFFEHRFRVGGVMVAALADYPHYA
jgi:hypothetical protein